MSGTISGTISLSGAAVPVADVIIRGAIVQGPGTLVTMGGVTVEGANLTDGAVWSNTGSVAIDAGQITSTDTSGGLGILQFDNQSNAVLDLTGVAGGNPLPLGILTNAGTLVSGGTVTTPIGMAIDDTGTILIGGGTLDFFGGGNFAGPVAGGGALELSGGSAQSGDFTIDRGFSHSGLLQLGPGGATLVLGGTTTLDGLVDIRDAIFQGPGTLLTTGSVTVEGANLTDGAVWSNTGSVAIDAGQITSTDTSGGLGILQFANQSNAVLDLTGVAGLNALPFGILTNAGTLVSGGTVTTPIGMAIDDTGTILIGGGTLDFFGGGNFAGLVAGGGALELSGGSAQSGDFTIDRGFSHSGLLQLGPGGATLVLGGTTTLDGLVDIRSAIIQGPGTLMTTGSVTVEGANLMNGAVWSNTGSVAIDAGQITSTDNSGGLGILQFDNQPGAILDLTGVAGLNALPFGILTNAGTLVSGGTVTTPIGMAIDDTGTILIGGGALNFESGGNFDGPVAGGGVLELSGVTSTFFPTAAITAAGLVVNPGTLIDAGLIAVSGSVVDSGLLQLDNGVVSPGSLQINAGGSVTGFGLLQSPITDNGLIAAEGGSLVINGTVGGAGALQIGNDATLVLHPTVGSDSNAIGFIANGTLVAPQANVIRGTVSGFSAGDTIDLTGFDFVAGASGTIAGGTLTVTSGGVSETLRLSGIKDGTPFSVQRDANVGTDIGLLCFCAGTRLATPTGEVPVERLAVGDSVLTFSGAVRPVVWIGMGRVLATRGRRNAATPVVVQRGALADNVPHHDLRVTRGHSFLRDDVLIPVEFLVNHRSIRWDDHAQEVALYHVELASHDVLLANGAPAESYRDDGNRWLFQNANPGWERSLQAPYAPVLTGGPIVDGVWRRLLERAGARPGGPTTDDPDMHLLVDGERVDGKALADDRYVFRLPAHPREVRVASRAGAPDQLGIARDPRPLGVAVRRIMLWRGARLRLLEASDPSLRQGFYRFEQADGIRWTDGDAMLPASIFDGMDGSGDLELYIGGTTRYPLFGGQRSRVAA